MVGVVVFDVAKANTDAMLISQVLFVLTIAQRYLYIVFV